MSRLYMLTVRWVTPLQPAAIDAALTPVGDWIRVSGYTWFVWTGKPSRAVTDAIRPVLPLGNSAIAVAIQPEAATGFADDWVWTWLNDKMQRQFRGVP